MSVQHRNECAFTGRITGNKSMPDGFSFRYIQNGTALLKLTVACNSQYKAADGSMKTSTVYIDCTAFGKLAEEVNGKLSLGAAVDILAEYRKRQYNARDGEFKTAHEFIIKTIEVIAPALAGTSRPPQEQQQQQQQQTPSGRQNEQRRQYSRPPAQQAQAPRQTAPPPQRQAPPPPPQEHEQQFGEMPDNPPGRVDEDDIPF